MRASVYSAYADPPAVERVDDPVPPPDGVVVAVRASGVCRSDWHAWMGHDPVELPHVGGHELAGEVVAVGPEVRAFAEGDRVTVPFCCGCGRCESCLAGETQVCENGFQPGFSAWGSFAELVALPNADLNVVKLPEALDYVEAASLGCRFMTSWAAVREHARVQPGEWVAVHGCGGVGLAATMIATAAGGRVIAVDVEPDKLELARSLGAAETVDARAGDAAGAIAELTRGGAQVSIDALGTAATCAASVRSLRRRGRHVQVGLPLGPDAEPPLPMMDVIARELRIEGCHGMAVRHYPGLLESIARGEVDPSRLIGSRIGLEQVGAELQAMGEFAQRGVTVMQP
jgi:alcohol dehydrogenase